MSPPTVTLTCSAASALAGTEAHTLSASAMLMPAFTIFDEAMRSVMLFRLTMSVLLPL